VADNIVDTIKSNWQNFEKMVAGKQEAPPKKDYFAHNWTPPKGRKEQPKPQKKVARKK
jgi:hypothetical protein